MVPVQAKSAEWDVAVTWSGLLWARDPSAPSISCRAGLMAAYLHTLGEWTSVPPASRWAQLHHRGGLYRPTGLAWPLANAVILLWCAMGEGIVTVAGPLPDVVGRVLSSHRMTRA